MTTDHPRSHGLDDDPDHPTGRGRPQPHRLFVALWPDSGASRHLATHLEANRPSSPDLRWQPAQRWHVTLAFVGDRAPGPVQRRLSRVPLPIPEPIRLAGAGTFGPVAWIGVDHGPWLAELARDVQSALDVSDRHFRAHVTVARARGRGGVASARAAAAHLDGYVGPPWMPDALTLVSSVAGPTPRYEVVAARPLGAG